MLVRVIQSLSSWRLEISLMPLQLRVAMRIVCWYGACSSCACGPVSRVASAGAPDFLRLACLRPSCFLDLRSSVRLRRAAILLVPRGGFLGGIWKSDGGDLLDIVGCDWMGWQEDALKNKAGIDFYLTLVAHHGSIQRAIFCHTCHNAISRKKVPKLHVSNGLQLDPIPEELQLTELEAFSPAIEDQQAAEQVEIQVKYEGYIKRQQDEIEKSLRHEHTKLPLDFDYQLVKGLSNEVVSKLNESKPESLGIASRISGVTPAAISILLVHLKKQGMLKKGEEAI